MHSQNCLYFSYLLIFVVGTVGSENTPKPAPFMTYECTGGNVTEITISDRDAARVTVLKKNGGYCQPATKNSDGVKACIHSFNAAGDKATTKITSVTILYGAITVKGIVEGIHPTYYKLSCLGKVGVVTVAWNAINVGTAIPTKLTVFHIDLKETPTFSVLDPTSPKYVGDLIKLQMAVSSDYVLLPQSCTAFNPVDNKQTYTFWDNCKVTDAAIIPMNTWKKSNTQATMQIDMYAFRFVDTKELIIKCQTTICPIDDAETCNMNCAKRKKRDANNHQPQTNSTSTILSLALQVLDRQFQENSSQALSPILYVYTIGFGIIYWITVKL